MGERFCGVVRRVTRDAATKCVRRKKIHQLRENKFADVHWESPRPKSPSLPNPSSSLQVGNTQKVHFPVLYQSLAPRHQQNCRTAVGADIYFGDAAHIRSESKATRDPGIIVDR